MKRVDCDCGRVSRALKNLMDCSRAIVGASAEDELASQAFDMFWAAQSEAREALRCAKSSANSSPYPSGARAMRYIQPSRLTLTEAFAPVGTCDGCGARVPLEELSLTTFAEGDGFVCEGCKPDTVVVTLSDTCPHCGGEGSHEVPRPQWDDPFYCEVEKCLPCHGAGHQPLPALYPQERADG
jgi:hypothetical protein